MSSRFDVVCGTCDGREMHVDLYQPTGEINHRTAILVHHGGGWRNGDRKMLRLQCEALASRGFTALAVEYRLLDQAPWPAQMQDVKTAIRWTRAHADELGIDLDKIVLQGHSAGAHLSLIAAGTVGKPEFDPDFASEPPAGPIAAVVAYYPPARLVAGRAMPDLSAGPPSRETMLAIRGADGSIPAAMLLGPAGTAEEAAAASPMTYLTEAFPPTILFHGTADILVAPIAALNLHHTLLDVGVPAEVHLIAGANHAFETTPSLGEVCVAAVTSFLSRYVVDPQGFAEEVMRTNPLAAMAAMRQG